MKTTNFTFPLLILPLLFFLNDHTFAQNRIHVNGNATGTNNGSSWTNAFNELQDAIDAANAGDSIWVAAGTYYPTVGFDADNSGSTLDREKTFYINKNITIHGQFQGIETLFSQRNKAHQTILSGDLANLQDTSDNAFHVVYIDGSTVNGAIDSSTVLDGFILEYGNATGNNFPNNSGAGIFNNGQGLNNESSPKLKDLIFRYHTATQGAAIYNDGSQNGAVNLTTNDLVFEFNLAQYGASCYNNASNGTSNLLFSNNNCQNNIATIDGGVLYNNTNNGTANILINHCYFDNNRANNGGICNNNINNGGTTSIFFSENTAKNNIALQDGGIFGTQNSQGDYNIVADNNFFEGNNTFNNGAIFNTTSINATNYISIKSSTFENNSAIGSGGIIYNEISNNSSLDLDIDDNKFTENLAIQSGGVLYDSLQSNSTLDLSFTNNTVEGGGSTNGGVVYNTATNAAINHLFEKNFVIFSNFFVPNTSDGGVIFQEALLGSTTNLLSNSNSYISNMVSFRGGAIFNRSDSSVANVLLVNDIFARNSSDNFGGAVCNDILNSGVLNTQITNSSFLDQSASVGNAVIAYSQNTNPAISSSINISNSIFWQSQAPSIFVQEVETINVPVDLNYSIYFDNTIDNIVVLPSWISGANNLDSDPLFTNPNFGDLTLQASSPAINAGNNDSIPIIFSTDNYGSPRINNNTIDIGAVEYLDSLVISSQQLKVLPACNGDSGVVNIILLGGEAPYTINGMPSPAPIPAIVLNDIAGNYQFNVVDANGLSKNVTVILTEPAPITLSTTSFSNGSASVTATGGTAPYTYQWDDPNMQTGDVATGLANGTYTVLVTDANGCTEIATISINLASANTIIAINNVNKVTVAPNPNSGQFNLHFELSTEQEIQPILYNLQGQIIHQLQEQKGSDIQYEIDLQQVPAGTYILKTIIDRKIQTQTIILH